MCTGWMDNEQLRGYGESRSEEGVCVCAVVLGEEKSPETGREYIPLLQFSNSQGLRSRGGKRSKCTTDAGERVGRKCSDPSALRCLLF